MPANKVVSTGRPSARRRSAGRPPAPVATERKRSLRLHGTIAQDIGIRIVSGRISPGRVLNGEIEASARLQVSRTAYREAVRILAAKGLVESRPKLGTRVSTPGRWHLLDPDVLEWMFRSHPDAGVLKNLFELRTIIEPAASALAATRRSKVQLQALRDSLDRMTRHSLTSEAGQQADREFHTVLLESAGNQFLASLSSSVAAALLWMPVMQQGKGPLLRDPIPDHERVYEAIAAKDPKAAAKAMTDLIQLALLDTGRRHAKPTRTNGNGRRQGTRA
jgi:DNA-binding FadR family transcriptional regulator